MYKEIHKKKSYVGFKGKTTRLIIFSKCAHENQVVMSKILLSDIYQKIPGNGWSLNLNCKQIPMLSPKQSTAHHKPGSHERHSQLPMLFSFLMSIKIVYVCCNSLILGWKK